jgi:hypothetical protein
LHLSARPKLTSAEVAGNLQGVVETINGGIGARSYVAKLRMPSTARQQAASLFPVQARIPKLHGSPATADTVLVPFADPSAVPSTEYLWAAPYRSDAGLAMYQRDGAAGHVIPVPVSWELSISEVALAATARGNFTLYRLGQVGRSIDDVHIASSPPGLIFDRSLQAGYLYDPTSPGTWAVKAFGDLGDVCESRDLVFTVWMRMAHVR